MGEPRKFKYINKIIKNQPEANMQSHDRIPNTHRHIITYRQEQNTTAHNSPVVNFMDYHVRESENKQKGWECQNGKTEQHSNRKYI